MEPIHIMRKGRHTANAGQEIEFTDAVFSEIAASYDPAIHEAPIVVGHPQSDGPAYGWIKRVEVRPDGLYAVPHQVNAEFADVVRTGSFKKVSGAFFSPQHKNSPAPGKWALRHVGFLGAAAPAVKGLRPVAFDDSSEVIEFEDFTLSLREHALSVRERAWARSQNMAAIDAASKGGRLPIGLKDEAIAFMDSLSDDSTMSFSDGDEIVTRSQTTWFASFLDRLPVPVALGEIAGGEFVDVAESIAIPKGFTTDPEGNRLHNAAAAHARKHNVSYEDAVRAVATFR